MNNFVVGHNFVSQNCIPMKKGHVGMKCALETGWTWSYSLQRWDSVLEKCVNIALMGMELQGVFSRLIPVPLASWTSGRTVKVTSSLVWLVFRMVYSNNLPLLTSEYNSHVWATNTTVSRTSLLSQKLTTTSVWFNST